MPSTNQADSILKRKSSDNDKIPKKIFQLYPTKDLPADLQTNIRKITKMNPDWVHSLLDDNDMKSYLESFFPEYVQYYERINPFYGAAKADFFRYLLIYREGGLYLDIKSTTTKRLSNSIHNWYDIHLSFWNNERRDWGSHPELTNPGGELQQWYILAPSNNSFIKLVIDKMVEEIENYSPFKQGVGKHGTLRTTGPIMFTKSLYPKWEKVKKYIIDSEKDLGLEYNIYKENKPLNHRQIFNSHYTFQKKPVIKPTTLYQKFYNLLWEAKTFLVEFTKNIKKRLTP